MATTVATCFLWRKGIFACITTLAVGGMPPTAAMAALSVSAAPTQAVSCSAGTCVPTAVGAVLNITELRAMLAVGNVTLSTTGAGGIEAGDLLIDGFLNWSDQTTLRLDAYHSVVVKRIVNVAGPGAVAVMTNNGGSGGQLSFEGPGRIAFHHRAAQLTIGGVPYVLAENVHSLAAMIARNPAGHFALAHDYDASVDGFYGASPILTDFTGTLEGLGNTISNLTMHNRVQFQNLGLFEVLDTGSVVADLRLVNVMILAQHDKEAFLGMIAAFENGTLRGDRANGRILAIHATAGGLIGAAGNLAMITSSSADVDVKSLLAGGLIGICSACTVTMSSASGAVATSKIKRSVNIAGGLIGAGGQFIDQCFATGSVTGGVGAYLGGLQGEGGFAGSFVSNSYALGELKVVAGANPGGFMGVNSGSIATSYAANGVLSGTTTAFGGFASQYPQVGNNMAVNNYWDTDTSGTRNGTAAGNRPGVTGLTTAQLTASLPTGFDPAIWAQSPAINHGLPYLRANPPH